MHNRAKPITNSGLSKSVTYLKSTAAWILSAYTKKNTKSTADWIQLKAMNIDIIVSEVQAFA